MIMERKRKRNESVERGEGISLPIKLRVNRSEGVKRGTRTKDEFLGRREHVEGKRDFVLVALALEPAEEGGRVEHCSLIKKSAREKRSGGWVDGSWRIRLMGCTSACKC